MSQRQNKNREVYFQQVDFIFYHEKKIRDAVIEKQLGKDNSISLFPVANTHGAFSDPTASKALRGCIHKRLSRV